MGAGGAEGSGVEGSGVESAGGSDVGSVEGLGLADSSTVGEGVGSVANVANGAMTVERMTSRTKATMVARVAG